MPTSHGVHTIHLWVFPVVVLRLQCSLGVWGACGVLMSGLGMGRLAI